MDTLARRGRLLGAGLFLVIGLLMGGLGFVLGTLGLIAAALMLVVALVGVRRFPERTGAYALGISLLPGVAIAWVGLHNPPCGGATLAEAECYSAAAVPALIICVIVGLAGAVILGFGLRR